MAGNLWRSRRRLAWGLSLAAWGILATVAGCSTDPLASPPESGNGSSYEERLDATAKEFAYYQLLDENLHESRWEESGVSLRVPKPFTFVPAPPRENLAEAHAASQEILGEPLPGVLGMWKAELPGKKAEQPKSAYLFLLSNQHFPAGRKDDALAFHQTLVEDVLANLSGLTKLPIDSDWKSLDFPAHGLPTTSATFEAQLPKTKSRADFTLYLMQHGKNARRDEIKVALLFVIPQDAVLKGSRPDVNPVGLSAETLQIAPSQGEST